MWKVVVSVALVVRAQAHENIGYMGSTKKSVFKFSLLCVSLCESHFWLSQLLLFLLLRPPDPLVTTGARFGHRGRRRLLSKAARCSRGASDGQLQGRSAAMTTRIGRTSAGARLVVARETSFG